TSVSIDGISVTAQMFNLVAVDESRKALIPMISWLDQRAEGAARALAEIMPPDVQFKRFTAVVSAKDIVPKILWLRDTAPEVYSGLMMSDRRVDPCRKLGALAHAEAHQWILWLEIATGGAALAWAVRMLGLGEPGSVDYTQAEQMARDSAHDMDGLLFAPWLSGERVPVFDDAARAAFVGLSLHHG